MTGTKCVEGIEEGRMCPRPAVRVHVGGRRPGGAGQPQGQLRGRKLSSRCPLEGLGRQPAASHLLRPLRTGDWGCPGPLPAWPPAGPRQRVQAPRTVPRAPPFADPQQARQMKESANEKVTTAQIKSPER